MKNFVFVVREYQLLSSRIVRWFVDAGVNPPKKDYDGQIFILDCTDAVLKGCVLIVNEKAL
jgi:hypothetical protein